MRSRVAGTIQAVLAFAVGTAAAIGVPLLAFVMWKMTRDNTPWPWAGVLHVLQIAGGGGLLVGLAAIPGWWTVVTRRPSFLRGSAAGLATAALAATTGFVGVTAVWYLPRPGVPDPGSGPYVGVAAVVSYVLALIATVIALPAIAAFGGLIGLVQQRRAEASQVRARDAGSGEGSVGSVIRSG